SKDTYPFAQILQRVFENLLIDTTTRDFPIDCPDVSVDVYVDFDIFCLAIKNLIDNALKYKTHGKVIIQIEDDQIAVKNLAQPFPRPIEEYFLPFFKNDKNPQSKGLGLGLYIIKNTIERQGLQLLYAYEEGYHIFRIKGAILSHET
ncbi:MAG: sensor histidine kinase, partial [Helicobacter sp.]|nr:sensor histidine kinase [Helicobacter sp.]